MKRSALLLVLLVGGIVGACGGSDDNDAVGTAAATTTLAPVTTVVGTSPAPSSTSMTTPTPTPTPTPGPTASTRATTNLDDVDWPSVIDDLDCSPINEGVEVVDTASSDVTGDGVEDAFVWVDCVHPTSGWPQQLEAFDGSSDPANPTRIGVLVPAAENLRSRELSFSGSSVTVRAAGFAERDPNCCPSLEITQSFTWDGSDFVPGDRTVQPKV